MLKVVPCQRSWHAVVAVAAAALLLVACGSTDRKGAGGPGEVTVPGAYGEVSLAPTAENVWALDPVTATELLEIGVTPTHVGSGGWQGDAGYEARLDILRERGVELVEPDKAELVLQAQPSLIIGVESPEAKELTDELTKIAPTVITANSVPWRESLGLLGQATGHERQARAVVEHLDGEIAATKSDIDKAGRGGETVSLMSTCGSGSFCAYSRDRTAGTVLAELGFSRPATHSQDQSNVESGFTNVSGEKLAELSAPIVFIYTGSVQFGAPSPLTNPLLDVTHSTYGEVDFGAWFGNAAFDVPWILHDIRAVVLGQGTIADQAGGHAIFNELAKVAA